MYHSYIVKKFVTRLRLNSDIIKLMEKNPQEYQITDFTASINDDVQSMLFNDKAEKSEETIKLIQQNLEIIQNWVAALEELFKDRESNQTVEQVKNTKQKDSQVIESLDDYSDKKLEIEEKVELLYEQIESLKLLLYDKELEVQEIREQLDYTSMDLCAAFKLPELPFDEAKAIARTILKNQNSINQALAHILSNIYNSTVKPLELEPTEESNSVKPLISAPAQYKLTNNNADKIKAMEVRKRAVEIRAKSKLLRERAGEIQSQFRKTQAEWVELGIKFVSSQAVQGLPNKKISQHPSAWNGHLARSFTLGGRDAHPTIG
jgi:hypothetical protein